MRSIIRAALKYFYDTSFCIGPKSRLRVGNRVALANTLFNTVSGNISIGSRSIFGQGVMVITGTHEFQDGMRLSLNQEFDDGSWGGNLEVPTSGFDIGIGSGVFVASGVIILGGSHIGNHSIVSSGAVVTRDFPDFSLIAGIPAKRIGDTRQS